MDLTNKFYAIGNLSEAYIDLYPSHINVKFALQVKGYVMTFYSRVSKRYNLDMYKTVMQMIDKLYPASRGYVNLNGEHYFTMEPQKSPTRLFLSGNISQSRDMIFFNFEYCQVEQEYPEDYFSILLEGYPLGDDKILNIISDSPRIFNITSDIVLPPKQNQSVMYSIDYIMNWGIVDGMICTMQEPKPRLFVCSWRQMDKQIDDDQLANYLLEWRILNNIK